MSDLQDLIHTNAHNAYEIGVKTERERIIKLLEPQAKHDESCYYKDELDCTFEDCHAYDYDQIIKLIKGEQK
jgi:hypothetical protein